MARFKEINATRQAVGANLLYDVDYWSSSESSYNEAWEVNTSVNDSFGRTSSINKFGNLPVLAFVAY